MAPTTRSIVAIAVSIVLGVAVSLAVGVGGARVGGLPVTFVGAGVAFAINWIAFVPAYLARTERWYDLTGTLTYLTVVIIVLVGGPGGALPVLVAVLVAIWALRLGTFLVLRISADGSDSRFDEIKQDPLQFAMSWTLQALWVVLTLAAAMALMSTAAPPAISWVTVVGLAIWVGGFSVEVVADAQKRRFRADPANEGRFISTGLWSWSRHPNYFGEITLWVGIAVIVLPSLDGWRYVALISPVFVAVLLTRISGVPMLEAKGRRRWGDDPSYRAYVERTPVLVPRPPSAS